MNTKLTAFLILSVATTVSARSARSEEVTQLNDCGNIGTIAARIADCAEKNADKAKRSFHQGRWTLVTYDGLISESAWQDEQSGLVWAKKIPFCLTQHQAEDACAAADGLTAAWLPSEIDYTSAAENGLLSIFPEPTSYWTSADGFVFNTAMAKIIEASPRATYAVRCVGW